MWNFSGVSSLMWWLSVVSLCVVFFSVCMMLLICGFYVLVMIMIFIVVCFVSRVVLGSGFGFV